MKTYLLRLRLHSGFVTPLQADTLFGHLCWAVRGLEGDEGLGRFLDPFLAGEPPFLISDGFPEGLLPKPVSADLMPRVSDKDIKRAQWLDRDDFDRVRNAEPLKGKGIDGFFSWTSTHNSIGRDTGRVRDEGGLFALRQYWSEGVDVYLKATSEAVARRVRDLVEYVSGSGFGRKASTGRGQFSVGDLREAGFRDIPGADAAVALNAFCPASSDPPSMLYRIFVKYGKLGAGVSPNPFKRPLLMMRTGAVILCPDGVRDYYGRMVKGIAPGMPQAVQYAFALALPARAPRK